MKTTELYDYMEVRSDEENVEWGLDINYLEGLFNNGLRIYFGVQLDNNGKILSDTQEPYKGFLSVWKKVNGWYKDGYEPTDDDWNNLKFMY